MKLSKLRMKYPAVLPFSEIFGRLAEFDAIIDVRSPGEFAEDHIPGAINCPVLSDAERVQVGTMYKQVSAFEAKKLGAALVARNIALHLETLFLDKSREWQPLIYCWRGGNRSGAMAHIFAKIGWPVTLLEGGYKAYRSHVNAVMPSLPAELQLTVLCGPTGSGKSRLLQVLAANGAQVLDLELLAAHRGSVLGNLPTEAQPSQKKFETLLWNALRHFDTTRPVFIECESKKVGNCRVPDALMEKMRAATCVNLELAMPNRVALLMQDYAHFVLNPAHLNAQLSCLITLHGREKIAHWHELALTGQMAPLVEALLNTHYDPAYLQSIQRNFVQFAQAQVLPLADICTETFAQAALQLQQASVAKI
jgi:tRNA 2-selenouridine synthase